MKHVIVIETEDSGDEFEGGLHEALCKAIHEQDDTAIIWLAANVTDIETAIASPLAHEVLDNLWERAEEKRHMATEDFDVALQFMSVSSDGDREHHVRYHGEIASGELEEMNVGTIIYERGEIKEQRVGDYMAE